MYYKKFLAIIFIFISSVNFNLFAMNMTMELDHPISDPEKPSLIKLKTYYDVYGAFMDASENGDIEMLNALLGNEKIVAFVDTFMAYNAFARAKENNKIIAMIRLIENEKIKELILDFCDRVR